MTALIRAAILAFYERCEQYSLDQEVVVILDRIFTGEVGQGTRGAVTARPAYVTTTF